MADDLNIEVVYAIASKQDVVNLKLPIASTVLDAVLASGLYDAAIEDIAVGIFGKLRTLDYKLQEGDRVEIYTPLLIDPKEARRQRAKRNQKPKKIRNRRKPKAPDILEG